jgi:hypothetical protein
VLTRSPAKPLLNAQLVRETHQVFTDEDDSSVSDGK